MTHPIISKKAVLYTYLGMVLLLCIADFLTFFYGFQAELQVALTSSVVYTLLMMSMALSLWYPVLYIDTKVHLYKTISQYLFTGVAFVGLWLLLGGQLVVFVLDHLSTVTESAQDQFLFRAASGILLYVLFVAVYHLLLYNHNLQEKNKNEVVLKGMLKEAQLTALKAQLNPHFLFNSLNSISSLTITNPDDARGMVNKLSDFLRYALKENLDNKLSIREELKNMNRYLEIEKVRFGEKLQCELEMADECKDYLVPAMILQPIYENAVKHGVYESLDTVCIRTYCRCDQGSLSISVINEYDPEIPSRKGTGTGLKHVEMRLQQLYGLANLLKVTKENNHFEVALTLPQEK